jgi:hypothetical protein
VFQLVEWRVAFRCSWKGLLWLVYLLLLNRALLLLDNDWDGSWWLLRLLDYRTNDFIYFSLCWTLFIDFLAFETDTVDFEALIDHLPEPFLYILHLTWLYGDNFLDVLLTLGHCICHIVVLRWHFRYQLLQNVFFSYNRAVLSFLNAHFYFLLRFFVRKVVLKSKTFLSLFEQIL